MNDRPTSRRWFFVCMASVLLGIVAVGFARSFYLRNILFAVDARGPELPGYIVLHGIVLTAWMLLFLSQTLLIANAHVRVHRLLGSVGAVLAAVVFAVSMVVVVRAVTRETSLVVIGDIALMILFAALVATGVRFRRTPAVH